MSTALAPTPTAAAVPPELFRASCLRGLARTTLTPAVAEQFGLALGTLAKAAGHTRLVVGRDGRLPSQDYAGMLMAGLNDTGVDVIDLGLVPIGLMQWAAHAMAGGCGVMVTGGRSAAPWNGFKPMLGGVPLGHEALQALQQRMADRDYAKGSGEFERDDHVEAYVAAVAADVKLGRPLRLVVDAGNGATAVAAESLFRAIGSTVQVQWPQVDGNFPNHFPDPTLADSSVDVVSVQRSSQQGELGIVFSCDGAGLGVVDMRGYPVEPERVLMCLAADLLRAQPGATIVGDWRFGAQVEAYVQSLGGRYVRGGIGHGELEAALREHGGLLWGDAAGHYGFADRWHGHDDALYAAARLAEAASRATDGGALLAAVPKLQVPAETRLKTAPGVAEDVVAALAAAAVPDAQVEIRSGPGAAVRWQWPEGDVVARAAITTPGLALRFGATNAAGVQQLQARFKAVFAQVRPDAALPF